MTPPADAGGARTRRVLALGGVAGPLLFAAVVVLAAALRPGYSHLHQFVSELGAVGTPLAGLMNYAGFLPTGVLLLAFAASTRAVAPGDWRAALGTVLLFFFGGGVVVAGLVRCDVGCPPGTGSWANLLHGLGSPVAFLCAIGALFLFGRALRGRVGWKGWGAYSTASAIVAVVATILLTLSLRSREWTGLWQRLLLIAVFTWCGAVGLRLYRRPRASDGA